METITASSVLLFSDSFVPLTVVLGFGFDFFGSFFLVLDDDFSLDVVEDAEDVLLVDFFLELEVAGLSPDVFEGVFVFLVFLVVDVPDFDDFDDDPSLWLIDSFSAVPDEESSGWSGGDSFDGDDDRVCGDLGGSCGDLGGRCGDGDVRGEIPGPLGDVLPVVRCGDGDVLGEVRGDICGDRRITAGEHLGGGGGLEYVWFGLGGLDDFVVDIVGLSSITLDDTSIVSVMSWGGAVVVTVKGCTFGLSFFVATFFSFSSSEESEDEDELLLEEELSESLELLDDDDDESLRAA